VKRDFHWLTVVLQEALAEDGWQRQVGYYQIRVHGLDERAWDVQW